MSESTLCPFCWGNAKSRMVEVYNSVFAIKDKYPVTESHLLILPKRHTRDYFSMTAKERMDADKLIRVLRNRITRDDPTVTGFNIGMNAGVSAGQTIFHAHIHLIPRRDKDTPNPHGGVRGVIPEKMAYTVSTAPEQKP
ncbi:MAG: HIT domain-containing protein [Desulfobacterales bacterium]|nr:HIT domain-containing protein [Desulfobacterales bacterium]